MSSSERTLRVAFRARGGLEYGWGHLVRTRRLALAWTRNRPADEVAIFSEGEGSERARGNWAGSWTLLREALELRDEEAWLAGFAPDLLFVDDLNIAPARCAVYSGHPALWVAMSDLGNPIPGADIVVCPQPLRAYPTPGIQQTVLSGLEYFVLDPQLVAGPLRAQPRRAEKLLIMLGGGLPGRLIGKLEKLITALQSEFLIKVILGYQQARTFSKELEHLDRVELVEQTEGLERYILDADIALSAGGYVKMELAAAGVPANLVSIVDHQEVLAGLFAEQTGAATYLGRFDQISVDTVAESLVSLAHNSQLRGEMSRAGRAALDGRGADRIVAAALRGLSRRP